MGLEVATYVNDFDASNPTSTDLRSQGDDHMRLIKQVLKNQFTGASRAFQIPTTLAKTADYSVVKADGESTIYVSTAGGVCTMTLPTLVAGDAGWKVHFVKTNSGANPMFVAPPSGSISSGGVSVTKARRSIPGIRVTAIWDGTAYFITRAIGLPIGSCVEFHGSSLPAGYEWPNGTALSSALNYPEYNSVMGGLTTLDKRGRIGITLDNLGGAGAGRLAGGIITGTAVGNTGGTDTVTLGLSQIPSGITSSANNSITVSSGNAGGSGSNVLRGPTPSTAVQTSGFSVGFSLSDVLSSAALISTNPTQAISVTSNNTTGGAHSNLQPSIMVSEILVVE